MNSFYDWFDDNHDSLKTEYKKLNGHKFFSEHNFQEWAYRQYTDYCQGAAEFAVESRQDR